MRTSLLFNDPEHIAELDLTLQELRDLTKAVMHWRDDNWNLMEAEVKYELRDVCVRSVVLCNSLVTLIAATEARREPEESSQDD